MGPSQISGTEPKSSVVVCVMWRVCEVVFCLDVCFCITISLAVGIAAIVVSSVHANTIHDLVVVVSMYSQLFVLFVLFVAGAGRQQYAFEPSASPQQHVCCI